MITFENKGDFKNLERLLSTGSKGLHISDLSIYGEEGVEALSRNTPVESGLTSRSWSYKITSEKGKTIIAWYNSNIPNGVPIAVILQYGHGTKNGGWVAGRDYINPSIRPLFDKISDNAWKEVTKI